MFAKIDMGLLFKKDHEHLCKL